MEDKIKEILANGEKILDILKKKVNYTNEDSVLIASPHVKDMIFMLERILFLVELVEIREKIESI